MSLQESSASELLSQTYALDVLESQIQQTQLENMQSVRAVWVARDQEHTVKPSES